jgi:transcription elongation GreA/GreB family factor
VTIGSHLTFGDGDMIAYSSPLGRLLVGAQVGTVREGELGGRPAAVRILAVWSEATGWVSEPEGDEERRGA